jgi:CRISPR-associated endoribonuclease Cas6
VFPEESMRLKIELISNQKVKLPVGYNAYIQALVYNFLDKADSKWLHDEGYKFENRQFRLFTFSSILERGDYIRDSIDVMKPVRFTNSSIKVRAITPIEVHSTIVKPDGKKLTYYYSPFEKEFNNLINENSKKKWKSLFRKDCEYNISIYPHFRGSGYERIVYFGTGDNKTIIKGWKGYFEVSGKIEILQFIYDAGLGSRNSQGFGMVEVVDG